MYSTPLVSVGIPTYNRAEMLHRAVESVLAQDYPNVEVVVSDNASTDGTCALCEEFCRRDGRVRYVRQRNNVGLVANYAEVFKLAHGDFYMALADDDWLESNYISECIRVLLEEPDLVLACGKPRMFQGEQYYRDGLKPVLLQESATQRVVKYLRWVEENVPFHGVMRRELAASVPPMPNVLAGDWLYVASIAFKGKIRTLESTAINKTMGGTSAAWEKIVRTQGLPRYQARIPYLAIAWSVFSDIAWASPAYASRGSLARLPLACKATAAVLLKFTWHYVPLQVVVFAKKKAPHVVVLTKRLCGI
jgi:glycosyltransferase involved in cell wall biosynthesis